MRCTIIELHVLKFLGHNITSDVDSIATVKPQIGSRNDHAGIIILLKNL